MTANDIKLIANNFNLLGLIEYVEFIGLPHIRSTVHRAEGMVVTERNEIRLVC